MDRPSIQRSDFPTVRRGYEPDAVDAHLRRVADEMESLRGGRGQPVAAAASAQVQRILEVAESTADQLRAEAGEEAQQHVHRVSTAARELLERLGAMHDELGAIMDRLREDAGRLSAELRSLERDVVEIAPAVEDELLDDALPAAEESAVDEPVAEEAMLEEPAGEAPPEETGQPETAAARARAKGGSSKGTTSKAASSKASSTEAVGPEAAGPEGASAADDIEAARLVALDMALAGTPREETQKYLAEHYSLADPAAVLDDVYALAGS
jgi:DivIVA domain-containing protein